jgi:O-antigen/teichoic acid export membrane protein
MTAPGSLARNVLSNWVVLATNVAYALVMTPLIVRTLGVERYGVWSFLNGFAAYSELLYLGLGSALVKFVAQRRAEHDVAGINRLASVVTSIYAALGLACLLVFSALSGLVPHIFAEPLPPDVARAASITCALLGVRLLLIFISSAFSGLLTGHDRFDLVNVVQFFSIVVRFVLTPVLLARGMDPLLTLAVLTAATVALELLGLATVAFANVHGLKLAPTKPKWSEVRWLYGFGLQSFFIVLAVKLISYTDTTVIGITLGAPSVALYALPLQLVEYTRMFIGGFAAVFLPRVAMSLTQGDHEGVRQSYLRSARIAFFLAGWLGALLISLGPMFLDLWVGNGFGDGAARVLVYLSIALMGQVLSSQVPLAFYQGLGLLAFPAAIMIVEAALNLGLSLWLAPRMGLDGVALATAIPAIFSVSILPRFLCRRLGIPLMMVVRHVAPGAVLFAGTIALEAIIALVLPSASWLSLFLRGGASIPLALAAAGLMFPLEERRAILRLVRPASASPADALP